MIEYLIGTGGDYTDFNAAVLALEALGPAGLGDDHRFRIISNIVNATVAPAGNVYLNGHTVSFINDNPPNGNPLAGYRIDCVSRPTIRTAQDIGGRGILIFDGLYFKAQGADPLLIRVAMETFPFAQWRLRRVEIKNSMFDGNGTATISLNCRSAEYSYWLLSNLKIWGHRVYGLWFGDSGSVSNPGETTKTIENVTVLNESDNCVGIYSNGVGDAGGDDTDYKNVVSVSDGIATGTKDWYDSILPGRISVNNCASSDATCPLIYGTGNIQNIVPASEFESLSDADPDFLFLRKGALTASASPDPDKGPAPLRVDFQGRVEYSFPAGMQLYNAGQAPVLSIYDIAGLEYGKYGDYPIGCHNAEVTI